MTEREELVERVRAAITRYVRGGDRTEPRGLRSFVTIGPVVVGIEEATRAAIAECEKDRAELEAQCAAMRGALSGAISLLCEDCHDGVPISDDSDGVNRHGKYHAHTGFNRRCNAVAQRKALSPDAGRKVRDVVRVASELCYANRSGNNLWRLVDELCTAISALGKP